MWLIAELLPLYGYWVNIHLSVVFELPSALLIKIIGTVCGWIFEMFFQSALWQLFLPAYQLFAVFMSL